MLLLVLALVLVALGLTVMVVELRRAPRTRTPSLTTGKRIVVAGALGALAMVAVSPSIGLVEERTLPVERPAEPWRSPSSGCGDDDGGGTLLAIIVIGVYVAVRGGPALVGMAAAALARSGEPRREPSGHFALRATTLAFAVTGGLATARLAACGAAPDRFTTYGAITPAGADGWRVDLALALATGDRADIPVGAIIDEELEGHHGGDMSPMPGSWTSARSGLQAWIGDEPVLFYKDETKQIVGSQVRHRDPSMIPPERRPHFAAWPKLATLDDDHYVIVGPAADGGTLAVKVDAYDLDASAATYADAGLLVRPRLLPWLLGAALGALGLALGTRGRRKDEPMSRMLAAWLLAEATVVMIYGHLAAFGLYAG